MMRGELDNNQHMESTPQDPGTLDQALDQHEKWVRTKGKEGRQLVATGVDYTGMDFSHRDMSGAQWTRCRFDSCTFYDTTFGESFAGATKLFNCTVVKSNFNAAQLTGTFLSDCHLDGCHFTGAKLLRVSATGMNGVAVKGNDFGFCSIRDSSLGAMNLTGSTFESCQLELVRFSRCTLGPVDFSVAKPTSSMLFNDCVLNGANFSRLLIEGSRFTGCQLRHAKFHKTLAKASNFSGADLTQADFTNADVSVGEWGKVKAEGAKFQCSMQKSSARLANFKNADFSHCALYDSDLSGSDLTGAVLDVTTNRNMVNFSGCTWTNGRRCKAGSLGVCYEEEAE